MVDNSLNWYEEKNYYQWRQIRQILKNYWLYLIMRIKCTSQLLIILIYALSREYILAKIQDSQFLRQLDQHYRKSMRTADHYSMPFKRITRLYHALLKRKNRRHVSVHGNVVDTSGEDKGEEAYLVIESDSFGSIKIHSLNEPVHYLCIGNDKKPVGIPKGDLDMHKFDLENCLFKEHFNDKYVQFRSVKYYNDKSKTGCLAFNKIGKGRKITRSKCGRKSTLFLERKSRFIVDVQSNGKLKNKLISLLRNVSLT